jgi:hypothetical protein
MAKTIDFSWKDIECQEHTRPGEQVIKENPRGPSLIGGKGGKYGSNIRYGEENSSSQPHW